MARNLNLSAEVRAMVKKDKEKLDTLVRQSVLEVINTAQTDTGDGGLMRVDTGFLRASGQLSFGNMPSGPTRGEKGVKYPSPSYTAKLGGIEADTNLFFGWTASYAAARESHDGFLEAALQKWQQIVDKNCARLKDE